MPLRGFHFENFVLDPDDRRLFRDGAPVELSPRYLDALALLLRNAGSLVAKDRFLGDVWKGVPVTDEALTQCIKTIRQKLGDAAARPRFIETVPKHGYRFVAQVHWSDGGAGAAPAPLDARLRQTAMLAGAGTIGAGIAGLIGGLVYGFAAASRPLEAGAGAASSLMVLVWLTVAVAIVGGAGVSCGIAVAGLAAQRSWLIAGGAAGGLAVGGLVKLFGIDAFDLLFGRSPQAITGAPEGLLLGGAVGLGAAVAGMEAPTLSLRRSAALAGICGGFGGVMIVLFGGRLMAGSFDQLVRTFPASRIGLSQIGQLFGERSLGPITEAVTAFLEGGLFAAGIVTAMMLAKRQHHRSSTAIA